MYFFLHFSSFICCFRTSRIFLLYKCSHAGGIYVYVECSGFLGEKCMTFATNFIDINATLKLQLFCYYLLTGRH